MPGHALLVMILTALLGGCTAHGISRGLYEGARARDQSLRSTPYEQSSTPLPSFDEYDRERRALSRPQGAGAEKGRTADTTP